MRRETLIRKKLLYTLIRKVPDLDRVCKDQLDMTNFPLSFSLQVNICVKSTEY